MARKTEEVIVLKPIDFRFITLQITGTAPLLVHRFGEKQKKMILDKQMGKAQSKKHEIKNPVEDFIESMYWLSQKPAEYTEKAFEEAIQKGAKFGFPLNGIKESAVSAGYRSKVYKDKVSQYGAFWVDSEHGEFAEIIGPPPVMREDPVPIGMGTDLRYRGQFNEWSMKIKIKYNAGAISAEQLVNLFQLGGFAVGIGEWRPEKAGRLGMYEVTGIE